MAFTMRCWENCSGDKVFKPILGEQFGDGVLRRADLFLSTLPKTAMAVGIILNQLLLFYLYFNAGPWVPLGLFFPLNLFLAAKYVGSEFSYVMAFMAAAGRTYIKIGFYPEDAYWWQGHWQFISSYTLYTLFCYLINAQLAGLRKAERAFDELSRLSETIISETDTGVLVMGEDDRCVAANPAVARLLGVSAESLRDHRLAEGMLLPEELLDAVRAVGSNDESRQLTLCLGRPATTWVSVSVRRIAYAGKSFVLLVFSDISEYRAAQDAAIAALNRAGVAERQLVGIGEKVQQRIGQELHDDLGQHLTGAAFVSEVLFRKLQDAGRDEKHDAAKVTAMINEAVSKTRYLSQGLYPDELREGGFCDMMERLAASVEAVHQVVCDFRCECAQVPEDPDMATHLFRITQEAVNNAIRHGHAHHIHLLLESDGKARRLIIEDDGCGVGNATGSHKGGSLGMRTMQCRADMIGARFRVSARENGGTRITVEMPLQ